MNGVVSYVLHGFMLLSLMLWILQIHRWKKFWPVAYLLSALLIVMPVNGVLVIEYSRGYLSDLSFSTLMIVFVALSNRLGPFHLSLSIGFYGFILVTGLFLFPASMGLSMLDPFVYGYVSNAGYGYFVSALAIIAVVSILVGQFHVAMCIVIALFTFNVAAYESHNVWNYLIDPIAFIYSAIALVGIGTSHLIQRFKKQSAQHA